MEITRKPFQGVINIIKFNWHFYVMAILMIIILIFSSRYFPDSRIYFRLLAVLATAGIFLSLVVSFYIYDLSPLYQLKWLNDPEIFSFNKIVNIHAGFDETSVLLKKKFPAAEMLVFDFYDPAIHTEVSIKRARKAYPAFPGTQKISTQNIPVNDNDADAVFIIFSAHEIRNDDERVRFFEELHRVLKPSGIIIVTEHLRDFPNFFAYNIGAFHFLPKKRWLKNFRKAKFHIIKEIKITAFITTFILEKNGTSS
jgi:SAM-dependent methyltransferase